MSNARLPATAIPDDQSVRLSAFVNFCNRITAQNPDTHAAMRSILAFIVEATNATGAAIALPEGEALVISCSTSHNVFRPAERIPLSSVAGQAFLTRKTMLANSFGDAKAGGEQKFSRIGTTVAAPIMQGRRAYAVLMVKYPALRGSDAVESQAVSEFAGVCGCVLGGAMQSDQVTDRKSDSTTGLPNQRAYERDVARQIDLCRKFGIPVAVAYFQLYGVDDESAVKTSQALRGAIRATDTAFRLNERVFAVVLKNCSERRAAVALLRIQRAIPPATAIVASPRVTEGVRGFLARANRELASGEGDKPVESSRSIWERLDSLTPAGQN